MSDDVQKIIDQNKNKKIDEIPSSNSEENILKHYNDNHYPVGAPGGRGGQFAPANYTGGGSSASSKDNFNKNNFKKSKKEDPIDAEYSKKEESEKEESKKEKSSNEKSKKENNSNNGNQNKSDDPKYDKDGNLMSKKKVDSMTKSGRDLVSYTSELFRNKQRGSRRINKKDYSDIPDAEMQRRINRMRLERDYGDLTGDTKYVQTGRERTREILQTIGAVVGIVGSIVGIIVTAKNK